MSSSDWVMRRKAKPSAKMRLICFPYAGGDANVFLPWVDHLPEEIELIAVQMPGRANRLIEPPIRSFEVLMEHLRSELAPFLDKPYVLLGHSLGGRVAFEFAHQTVAHGLPTPLHYICSGCRAPHLPRSDKTIYQLPDNEFLQELIDFGGSPRQVLEDKELMKLLLPMLKADFLLAETYKPADRDSLTIPSTVFNGTEDYTFDDDFRSHWQTHFTKPLDFQGFNGGHFFINDLREEYLQALNERLAVILSSVDLYTNAPSMA